MQARHRRFADALVELELGAFPGALRLGALVAARRVASTSRLRSSSPGPIVAQPAAISGCRLRVSVEASRFIARASSPGRTGPSRTIVLSSEYWVVFRPAAGDDVVEVPADPTRQHPHLLAAAAARR